MVNTSDPSWGGQWCMDQNGEREAAISAYRKALQYSWQIEIEQTSLFRERPDLSWDKFRALPTS